MIETFEKLQGCAGWYVPMLFAHDRNRVSSAEDSLPIIVCYHNAQKLTIIISLDMSAPKGLDAFLEHSMNG